MNTTAVERTQTTVSVSKDALETVDELSRLSGVSRSRLFDMAVRRFAYWASNVHPEALADLAKYETEGRTMPYVRRSSRPIEAVSVQDGGKHRSRSERPSEMKPGPAKAYASEYPKSDKLIRKDR